MAEDTASQDPSSPSTAANVSRKRKRASSTEQTQRSTSAESIETQATAQEIVQYLDANAGSTFTITTSPRTSGDKEKVEEHFTLESRFGPHLDIEWEITPARIWDSMKKFKKFTIGDVQFGAGDCIYVKHDRDDSEAGTSILDIEDQWKAIVLEVRAIDGLHVQILVAWLNRPRDMPGGQKTHHGHFELIPTNQLDVIDALTVNGKISLTRWDVPVAERPLGDRYFWRQTFDQAYTRKVYPAKPNCIEERPDAEQLVLPCTNPKCKFQRRLAHV